MAASGQVEVPVVGTPTTPLAVVGVAWIEEQLYRRLLARPQATLAELAAATGTTYGRARRAVATLEQAGLLSRRPGTPARYVPAPPDVAVQALVSRRQEELERAQLHARLLLEDFHRRASSATELVEIINGREAVHQRSVQLIKGAREEILMFDKPPYIGSLDNPIEFETLRRGLRWRAVYSPESLRIPGRTQRLHRLRLAGEQARVSARVQVKLTVADRRLALLPLAADEASSDTTAILVHPCSLLSSLVMLFETLWAGGAPLTGFGAGAEAGAGEPAAAPGDAELLALLTAGFKDEAIARNLGVSLRTARRRISRMMQAYGVETRFQLGLAVGGAGAGTGAGQQTA